MAVDGTEWLGTVVGLAVGAAGGWVAGRYVNESRMKTDDDPTLPPAPGLTEEPDGWGANEYEEIFADGGREDGDGHPPEAAGTADAERDRLVEVCIDVSDRLRSANPALWQRMQRGLAEVGVDSVLPDGERFDPDRHEAMGTEPTEDPGQDLRVVTDLPGYVDRGRSLRRPQVVVYRLKEGQP